MDSSSLKMPALGRPFSLGMLYDARKDELITGFSMWKEQFLEKKTKSEHNHSSSFQVLSSDSLQEKSSLCDLGTSLKASFLSGLIEVGGSAKYLNDKKEFKNQSRVILHYRAISYLSKLLMTPSEAQSEGELTDKVKSMATHVVTGIQYGANAFFVFDSEKAEEKPFQATLKAAIQTLIADGNTSSSLKEEESFLNSISCKFYGDFLFENNPTTFEEALKTYQSLSKKLLEDTKNSVPVQVFLTPLKSYDPTAAAVTGEICEGLITKAQNIFEDLSQIEMRCNDILDMTALKNFSSYYNIFQKFSDLCKMFEKNLRDFLKENFPLIRAGKVCNSSVEKELDLKKTPLDNLERWISDKEAEVTAMNICLKSMEGIKIVPNESQLKTETFAQGVVHALCFTFTSLEDEDPYIDQMESSLHSQSFKNVYKPKQDQWYHSNAIIQQLRRKAEDLQNMAKGLKANSKFLFLVAAANNPKYQGASIYYYKEGCLVSEDFSKPGVPPAKNITSKEDLIWYACDLTLNPNTANGYLVLSDENKKATCTSTWKYYDSHPERFDKPQVLCNEGLCGERQHYYWEVEWSEGSYIGVGVAIKSIERQGVLLGDNEKSWYFGQYQGLVAKHNGQEWPNPTPSGGVKKIGVYLNFGGGTLSFYKVSCNTLEHLYTFKTSFNDHVYPGFYIYPAEGYCMLTPVQ
ncbi:stonustoxin subunit alpha-like [Cyprinodon tularosa]|uniref:stonustoxin subunit alpha-like n=1 Tax=Cyprinodon tularosa TaxID=77115 RepID=UPI0018E22FEC|nr:stonustoxin subunit alpha-like [Cyprinodon tularosa]